MKLVRVESGCFSGFSEVLYDGPSRMEMTDTGVTLLFPTETGSTTGVEYRVELDRGDVSLLADSPCNLPRV